MKAKSIVLLTALCLAGTASAEGYKVIANRDLGVSSLARAELERIYTGKKSVWASGTRLQPVLLEDGRPATAEFIHNVVKKTVEQYHAYWQKALFSGAGVPPKSMKDSAQVIDFVARNPGAFGVVEASSSPQGVTVVQIQ